MAVQLFKKDIPENIDRVQWQIFDEYNMQDMLNTGEWFLSPEDACKPVEVDLSPADEIEDVPGEEDGEEALAPDVIDEKSDEEIRAMGKEASIRNWHNMKIDNLKAKLNDTES